MDLKDKVVVVTGGAAGIGKAMAKSFVRKGARAVIISDLGDTKLHETAEEVGCDRMFCDVTSEREINALVAYAVKTYGRIDLYCSNAGATDPDSRGVVEPQNEAWQNQWELNVMAHVYASRALLPAMIESGGGFILITASAAGLLAALTSGPYTVTKAAAIKFAELLAITYGDQGIKVSVLCPQGVNTAMAPKTLGDGQTDGIIEAEKVADVVIDAISEERFYVLPHPEVEEYVRGKGNDIDRWISGMQRLRRRSLEKN